MFLRKPKEPNPFDLTGASPPTAELPKGYHLRRVGPYEWVAEPASRRWYVWTVVCAAAVVSAFVTALLVRRYYHAKATAAVVAVNGVPIRRDHLVARLEDQYGRQVAGRMVADELARQYAVYRGVWPTESQVEERFRQEKEQPGFADQLLRGAVSEAQYRERLYYRLATINALIKGVTANEAEARDFYERNIDPRNPRAVFRRPERMQAAAIACRTRQDAEKASLDLARNVPWPEVVLRYSVHPSRNQAGLLRPLYRGRSEFSRWPAAEAAIFRLREGDRSEPVQAGEFWWIVRCIRKWPAEVLPYEKVRKDAEMGARIEKGAILNGERLAKDLAEFVAKADIQVFDMRYQEVARPTVSPLLPTR